MIEIQSAVEHDLGQQEATCRIHRMVASMTELFPQQVHQINLMMKDHRFEVSFAAYGYLVSWRAEVLNDRVALTGWIPESAKRFETKMEQAILSRIEEALQAGPTTQARQAA